jgi:hypothetical protein
VFEKDRLRKLELENVRMKGQLSDLQNQNRESSADHLAPNTEPRSEPSSEPFTYPQIFGQARKSQQESQIRQQPKVPLPGSNAAPRGTTTGGVYSPHQVDPLPYPKSSLQSSDLH